MKRYVIDSVNSMVDFFADLHARTWGNFAPEDDLGLLVDQHGVAIFSKAETAYFDDIILDCFVYCADHHLDIYDIAELAHVKYYSVQSRMASKGKLCSQHMQ